MQINEKKKVSSGECNLRATASKKKVLKTKALPPIKIFVQKIIKVEIGYKNKIFSLKQYCDTIKFKATKIIVQ
jgi:hypothetical protein